MGSRLYNTVKTAHAVSGQSGESTGINATMVFDLNGGTGSARLQVREEGGRGWVNAAAELTASGIINAEVAVDSVWRVDVTRSTGTLRTTLMTSGGVAR